LINSNAPTQRVMAGHVPAIRRGAVPLLMAGSSPAMTIDDDHPGKGMNA